MSLSWVPRVHSGRPRRLTAQSVQGIPAAVRVWQTGALGYTRNAALQATRAWHTGASFPLSPSNELSVPSLLLLTLHLEESPDLQFSKQALQCENV